MERRPGGLTALAVFNFIWALRTGLGSLGFLMAMSGNIPGLEDIATPTLLSLFATYLVGAAFLVASGIGYLGCRRVLGFWCGVGYALTGIASAVAWSIARDKISVEAVQEGMFPIMTLVLLATVFRRDFFPPKSAEQKAVGEKVVSDTGTDRASHMGLIAMFSLRYAMRNGSGVLFLILIVVLGVSFAGDLISTLQRQLAESGQTTEAAVDRLIDMPGIKSTIEGLVDADPAQVDYLLEDRPALFSAFLMILMVMTPYSICLSGFNQTAGDIGTRGLRYLLLRTERKNVFFGRFLGTSAFSGCAMAFLVLILLLYIQLGLGAYGFDLWTWGAEGLLALLLLALPHLALCSWVSGGCKSAFAALAMSLMAMLIPLIIIKSTIGALDAGMDMDLSVIERVIPWGWKYELVSHDMGQRVVSSLVMLGFTAFFLFLGNRHFGRRDL